MQNYLFLQKNEQLNNKRVDDTRIPIKTHKERTYMNLILS
jgi:hypothetical protein